MPDSSGSITVGGTAQALLPDTGGRRRYWIQNTSAGELRVNRSGTASATAGISIPAGALYESPADMGVTGAISVWGATTGQTFVFGDW